MCRVYLLCSPLPLEAVCGRRSESGGGGDGGGADGGEGAGHFLLLPLLPTPLVAPDQTLPPLPQVVTGGDDDNGVSHRDL